MITRVPLRRVPVSDRAWLLAALEDALQGRTPLLSLGSDVATAELQRLHDAQLPEGAAVLVHTSGSTGIPKTVALSARALITSAQATHAALGGAGQWLVALPTHLIAGLQTLVRSHLAGVSPVFAAAPFNPNTLITAAEGMQHARRYVALVPVQLARLLDLAERNPAAADTLRGFAAVLVGGQHVSVGLRQRAHELGITLRCSYGMTETAGGCVYDGVPIGDTALRVRAGEVQVAGSCLALQYVGDTAQTKARFVEDHGTRWYRTGDVGELLGGVLTVTGRFDRVIVSGGVNVSLDAVQRVVQQLPGWQHTAVVSLPHAEWGEQVVLVREKTAHPTATAPESVLRDAVKQQLGAAAAPKQIIDIDALPHLAGGKLDLTALTDWVAGHQMASS